MKSDYQPPACKLTLISLLHFISPGNLSSQVAYNTVPSELIRVSASVTPPPAAADATLTSSFAAEHFQIQPSGCFCALRPTPRPPQRAALNFLPWLLDISEGGGWTEPSSLCSTS